MARPLNVFGGLECPECSSKNWYRRKNGKFVCRKCGNEWEDKEIK